LVRTPDLARQAQPREVPPVSLRTRLDDEIKAAMRSGDAMRRDALRMILAAVQRVEKEGKHTLSDEEMVSVLARELKVRTESLEAFTSGGRSDLAAREAHAIAIVNEFLPQPLSEQELRSLVDRAIAETGAASPRDMGKVMGWLSPKIKGRADGKVVSQMVTQALAARAAAT
jgi:uncharacterized protein YqeY